MGITERSAFGIVTDLTEAGYLVKQKDGRRSRYQMGLVGTVLMEQNDDWAEGRRYMGPDILAKVSAPNVPARLSPR